MLNLLVPLGIVVPTADDLSLQQQVVQRELGMFVFMAGSRKMVQSFPPWSFSYSNLTVQQRPVQDSVEAGQNLD